MSFSSPFAGILSAILVLLCSLSLIVGVDSTSVPNDFIHHTCNKTREFRHICVAVIDSDPRQDLKSNLSGLLTIFLNQSLLIATHNYPYILEQLKRTDLDYNARYTYNNCVDMYQVSIGTLSGMLDGLVKKQETGLSGLLTSVYFQIERCDMDIDMTPTPDEPPAMLYDDQKLMGVVNLALMVSNLIECNTAASCVP